MAGMLAFLTFLACFEQNLAMEHTRSSRQDPKVPEQDLASVLAKLQQFESQMNSKEVDQRKSSWGKVFVWTRNVSSTPGPSYFHCLKRFGPYATWALPAGSPVSPPNQPCTAFYIKKYSGEATEKDDYINNAICTKDNWCLSGAAIANTDGAVHGDTTNGRTRAIKFEGVETQSRSVRAYLNTNTEGSMPQDDTVLAAGGWQCMQKLVIQTQTGAPDMGMKVTTDDQQCADIDLGWIE